MGGPPGHVVICNGDNRKTYPDDRRVTCAWPCPWELASRAQQAAAWYLSGLGDQRGKGWCGLDVSELVLCRDRAFVPSGGGSFVLGAPWQADTALGSGWVVSCPESESSGLHLQVSSAQCPSPTQTLSSPKGTMTPEGSQLRAGSGPYVSFLCACIP